MRDSKACVFVIAVRDCVVALDIVDSIREFDPAAVIVTATCLEEAHVKVRSLDRLTLAFVEAGPDQIEACGVDSEITGRGGRLVLLGDEAEDAWDERVSGARRWLTLRRPFGAEAVHAMMVARLG